MKIELSHDEMSDMQEVIAPTGYYDGGEIETLRHDLYALTNAFKIVCKHLGIVPMKYNSRTGKYEEK